MEELKDNNQKMTLAFEFIMITLKLLKDQSQFLVAVFSAFIRVAFSMILSHSQASALITIIFRFSFGFRPKPKSWLRSLTLNV